MKLQNMMSIPRNIQFLASLGLTIMMLMSACVRPSSTDPPTPTSDEFVVVVVDEVSVDLTLDWYVATDGDDSNSCTTPGDACLTLSGAYTKSRPFDRIHMAAGTYMETGISGSLLHLESYKNVTVIGAGATDTILDAGGLIGGVYVGNTSTVRLENLTIQNTIVGPAQGCVATEADGSATLVNVILRNCQGRGITNWGEMIIEGGRISDSEGSGIYNWGDLTATGTIIRDNRREGINHGGTLLSLDTVTIRENGSTGILTWSSYEGTGNIRIINSHITENQLYGIHLSGQQLVLHNSTIENHLREGLRLDAGTHSNITESIIQNNGIEPTEILSSGRSAGIHNTGILYITRSQVIGNGLGGIWNHASGRVFIAKSEISGNRGLRPAVYIEDETGYLSISQSLIARNHTGDFAAVYGFGTTRIFNSTISNNTGPGVWLATDVLISYSTIAENGGYGIPGGEYVRGAYPVDNTIIANNAAGQCSRPITSVGTITGTNMDTDGSCGFPAENTYTSAELGLAPLADNGGPTMTHALREGSPAIDAATGSCLLEDQRGVTRPVPVGGGCDVGAYEGSIPVIDVTPIPPTPTSAPALPNAPSSLAAIEQQCNSNDGYIVQLTWKDNATNEAGYRVYHSDNLIDTIEANATQYTTGDLGTGGVQTFYVVAFNAAGNAQSNTAQEDGCIF